MGRKSRLKRERKALSTVQIVKDLPWLDDSFNGVMGVFTEEGEMLEFSSFSEVAKYLSEQERKGETAI